jgi:hypothetical protein
MDSKTMTLENSARYPAGYVSLHSTLYVLRVTQCQQPWHSRHPRHPRHRVHTLKTLYWHCRDDDGITTFEIGLHGLQCRLMCLAARPFQALLSLDSPLRAR